MVVFDITSVPSTPAWVHQFFFFHDTLIALLDTFPLEAEFPGSALEREQSLQGNRSRP